MTICWKCARACGGCSWSARFEPVDGWVAKRTNLKCYSYESESYDVRKCPLFEYEYKRKCKHIYPDGARALAVAVLYRAVADRRRLVRELKTCAPAKRAGVECSIEFLDKVFDDDSLYMQILDYSRDDFLSALRKKEGGTSHYPTESQNSKKE